METEYPVYDPFHEMRFQIGVDEIDYPNPDEEPVPDAPDDDDDLDDEDY